MVNNAVSDTGPILHLTEINLKESLNVFSNIFIPEEVSIELRKNRTPIPSNIKIIKLKAESKDTVKILTNEYNLDLGEAAAISLTLQEKTDYFITDDLEAREVAKNYNIQVHGTVGIILRAFREKIIKKEIAIEKVKELKTKSSLFITQDLINQILDSILSFKDKGRRH